MRYAVLFPGQGSQFVGMGGRLFDDRSDLLGPAADRVLGWSLEEVCRNGPEDELRGTDRAQPALYATAFALWDEFRSAVATEPVAAAGHSLGEYTALAAAGALDYWAGLRLVAARGRAMAAAAAQAPSGMAVLLGAGEETAEAVARERRAAGGALWVANLNAPGQTVVAGGSADIAWVVDVARERGIRRAIPLPVAGAFHSPFMESAAVELAAAVSGVGFLTPAFPVWSNTTAVPANDIGASLVAQLTAPVRFAESLVAMRDAGVDAFVHIGPGDVTAGMAKRTVAGAEVFAVTGPEDVPAVAAALSVQFRPPEGGS